MVGPSPGAVSNPQLVQLPDQRAIAMSAAATAPKQTFQGSGSIGLRRAFCVIAVAAMSHFGPLRRSPRREVMTTWCLAEVLFFVEHGLNGGSEMWLAVLGNDTSANIEQNDQRETRQKKVVWPQLTRRKLHSLRITE